MENGIIGNAGERIWRNTNEQEGMQMNEWPVLKGTVSQDGG
jgi:hypothetical protein